MNSIDTNVFLYAVNTDCPEYQPCRKLIETALESPEAWIISDQVWFELYRLMRSFPARQVFDLVLAITLKKQGVKRFFTRNVKDFDSFGFFEVVDPVA